MEALTFDVNNKCIDGGGGDARVHTIIIYDNLAVTDTESVV
jgi:hypothetical protein